MKLNNFWHNVPRNTPEPGGNPTPTLDPAVIAAAQPGPVVHNPGPDLSFIPQDFHKDGAPDLAGFSAHYQELVAQAAQAAERNQSIPETFAFGLPADMKYEGIEGLPADFQVELTPDDPLVKPLYDELGGALKKWATEGLPATAGQDLMAIMARYQAVEYAQSVKAIQEDMGKLGTTAQQEARVSTISRALDTRLPADEATALKSLMRSSGAIKALERLLTPRTMTVPASPPPNGNLEGLTPFERLKAINAAKAS